MPHHDQPNRLPACLLVVSRDGIFLCMMGSHPCCCCFFFFFLLLLRIDGWMKEYGLSIDMGEGRGKGQNDNSVFGEIQKVLILIVVRS